MRRTVIVAMVAMVFLACGAGTVAAVAPTTVRADVSNEGAPSDGAYYPSISGSGRFIAFEATHGLLTGGGLNTGSDVYVFDRRTGRTSRVSVRSNGGLFNDWTGYAAISANGRFVTYCGEASNAVKGDENDHQDVFVHDRRTGRTTIASVSSTGRQGNADSGFSSVSSDGRWVAFTSRATNLVKGDTNGSSDLFMRDAVAGTTRLVTRGRGGAAANGETSYIGPGQLTADGRYLVFASAASNLVRDDTNGTTDVFAWDRTTGRIRRVSVASDGGQADGYSGQPTISAGGRYVVFQSLAADLVADDENGHADVFIHDLLRRTTRLVSVSSDEVAGNSASDWPTVSADGRFVAFFSNATNLDGRGVGGIFVRDRGRGTTRRASVAADGITLPNSGVDLPYLSANGGFVVFQSTATNLVPDDSSPGGIYVRGPLR